MSNELTEQEVEKVLAQSEEERLSTFLADTARDNEVWTIGTGEELVVLGDDSGRAFVAVWPHSEYAIRWAEEAEFEEEVDLVAVERGDWTNEILPGLAEAKIDVAVFPTPDGSGAALSAGDLQKLMLESAPQA